MKSLRVKAGIAIALVAVAVGVSFVMRDADAVASSAGWKIDCYSAVDLPTPFTPDANTIVVFNRVALGRGTPNVAALGPSYGGPYRYNGRSYQFKYALKNGLSVRRHGTPLGPPPGAITPIEIIVPLAWRTRAAMSWGNAATSWRVRVAGCRSTTQWVVFTGGFGVTSPACVPLIARMGNRSQRIHVAVGRPC